MRASKYQLESCGSPLYLRYSTPSQILARTTPDLSFLTTAHSQSRINIDARVFRLEALLLHWNVTTCYDAFRVYAPIHNLVTYHLTVPLAILLLRLDAIGLLRDGILEACRTLVDSVVPICYLGKPSLIIHGPLGRFLLILTIPCQEGKPIAMPVNFLLTSESIQSMSYSLSVRLM
jgi:hypothetical protein